MAAWAAPVWLAPACRRGLPANRLYELGHRCNPSFAAGLSKPDPPSLIQDATLKSRSRPGFMPDGLLFPVPAQSRFPETMVCGPENYAATPSDLTDSAESQLTLGTSIASS